MTGTIYRASGVTDQVELPRNPSHEIEQIIGGFIETARVKGGTMYFDAEAETYQLPMNATASKLHGSPVYGDVVVVGKHRPGYLSNLAETRIEEYA